jgi:uncharacterized protein HemY
METLLAPTAENFNIGMSFAVLALFLLLAVVTFFDIVLQWRSLQPIGRRVQLWSTANPILAALVLGTIGALLAHFFGNDIRFETAPNR